MKVVSYLNSVPAGSLGVNSQKELLLRYFVAGIEYPDRGLMQMLVLYKVGCMKIQKHLIYRLEKM
jgi:hypothetical protein